MTVVLRMQQGLCVNESFTKCVECVRYWKKSCTRWERYRVCIKVFGKSMGLVITL